MTVVPAAGEPGSGTADPSGSSVSSAEGEAAVTFPPGAVAGAAPFRVVALDPASVPALSPDHLTLAAASFPDPVALSGDAEVAFALPSWIAPGTVLPLLSYDEGGGTVGDVGRTAVVDATGTRAAGPVDHFSGWAIAEPMPAGHLEATAGHLAAQAGPGALWWLHVPTGLDLLEGLRVPVLLARRAGPGSGAGPFLRGVTARWRLAADPGAGSVLPLSRPGLVQPSGDGWSVGLVLDLPQLPWCDADETAGAFLDLTYPTAAGASKSLSLPFTIECLDELVFDAATAPSPVPTGATHEVVGGERIVTVPPDASYRFSRVQVGAGGVLRVREAWVYGGPSSLRIEVTGDFRVDGTLRARGLAGAGGGHGSGADEAGFGGLGGTPSGGRGGMGGPEIVDVLPFYPFTVERKEGQDGLRGFFPLGGAGGAGGARWDNASWLSLVVAGAEVLFSAGTVVANPTGFQGYYELATDAYAFDVETVKYEDKEANRLLSAGGGGRAGPSSGAYQGPAWWVYPPFPRPGGGGGGSGKMEITGEPDAAGAGGGGGGGAAPNVEIIAGGAVIVGPAGFVDGHGGNGGRGGNGSRHSWTNQAAPGGGGAGGSGAGLHVASRLGLRNDGTIYLRGGSGHLGGEIRDEGAVLLLASTFGEHGPDGEVRLDGRCAGGCDEPATRGAYFHEHVAVSISDVHYAMLTAGSPAPPECSREVLSSSFTQLVNGGEAGGLADVSCQANRCPSDRVRAQYTLQEGTNVLSVRRNDLGVEPHPWLRSYVFHFAGLGDADGDGLIDGVEAHLGTSPTAPDSDGDGLDDFDEAVGRHTNPLAADSDGDGFGDGLEVDHGFDPLDPASHPAPLPAVVSTAPAAGATGVPVAALVSVTFSEPMDPAATALVLSPPAPLVPPRWSPDGSTVTIGPDPILAFGTAYTLSVESADLEGYPLAGAKVFTFATEGGAPPPLAANDVVSSFAAGPDGTVYLGGSFTRIGRRTGGGIPLDAATGALVEPFSEVAGSVHDVVSDGAGGWWIGGSFVAVGGVRRPSLAHLRPDGSLDAAFDAGFTEIQGVESVAASGGRIFVWTYGDAGGPGVWAFDAASGTRLWATQADGGQTLLAVEGILYVGGTLTSVSGEARNGLAALDAATGALLAWDPQLDGPAYALAWSGAALYVGGSFTTAGGAPRANLAAFDATGALTGWSPGADGTVLALAGDGTTIYAGGSFFTVGGEPRLSLAAVDASGAVTGWDPGEALMSVEALAVQGGTVYAGGWFWTVDDQPRNGLAAWDAAGALLPWAPYPLDMPGWWGNQAVTHAVAASGGVVFAGGEFVGIGGEERLGLAAVDVRGALLPWNPGPGAVTRVALLGERALALGSSLRAFDAASGTPGWEVPFDLLASALVSDGSVAYVGGQFTTVAGVPRAGLAAIDASGAVTAWNPGTDGITYALALGGDLVYAGGSFTSVAGQPRPGLAAIDASGVPASWAPSLEGGLTDLAVAPAAVYLGGALWVNGQQVGGIAALDFAGGLLPWAPVIDAYTGVRAIAVDGSTIYLGGAFGWANGAPRPCLAAVDATGTLLPWRSDVSGSVREIVLQGSRLWVGGDFTRVGNWPAQGFAVVER